MSAVLPEGASPQGKPACEAIELGGLEVLHELGPRWDDLVRRSPEPMPFLQAGWLLAWWSAFGNGKPRVVGVYEGGARTRGQSKSFVGGALFSEGFRPFRGIPVRTLALAANVHSNRADLLVDRGHAVAAARAIARWAHARRPRWTLLRLDEVAADSEPIGAFRDELVRLGHPAGEKPGSRPPFVPLEGGIDGVMSRLKSKWKSNLRNREKRLGAIAALVHECVDTLTPDLDSRLEECFAVEARAWKGDAGSAILSDTATHRFYREVAFTAAEAGTFRLHTLRAGGRLAAFQLDLEHDGVEYVLKIGYEPELAPYSPGALLLRRVIERASGLGLRIVDLLGDDMPWKRDWTSQARFHVKRLVFSRGAVGRALHALEFSAVPYAKHLKERVAP